MVIFFNNPKARNYLLQHRKVYTLRPHKRKRTGSEIAVVGSYTNWRPLAKVEVRFIKEIRSPEELKHYVDETGFLNAYEWWREANYSRFLYLVVVKELIAKPEVKRIDCF